MIAKFRYPLGEVDHDNELITKESIIDKLNKGQSIPLNFTDKIIGILKDYEINDDAIEVMIEFANPLVATYNIGIGGVVRKSHMEDDVRSILIRDPPQILVIDKMELRAISIIEQETERL